MATEQLGVGGATPELRQTVKGVLKRGKGKQKGAVGTGRPVRSSGSQRSSKRGK